MNTVDDVHEQFASFFNATLQPYAYRVSKKLSEGHICVRLDDMESDAHKALLDEAMVASASSDTKQPFVLHNNRLYLQRYFNYETMILDRLQEFIDSGKQVESKRIQDIRRESNFITTLFKRRDTEKETTDWQQVAAISAVLNNFTIITGGPGTGKTTTVAKILSILFKINPDFKVALAAPTGKAATRMAESLRLSSSTFDRFTAAKIETLAPQTLHRLLKSRKDSPYFTHNRQNPLNYDLIIVDESSMIGVALFAKLLDAIPSKSRLIMLGDKDQLASVEAGSLFGDLCQAQTQLNLFSAERTFLINELNGNLPHPSFKDTEEVQRHPLFQHVVELKVSYRFSSEGGIGKFSKAIINNQQAVLDEFMFSDIDSQVEIDCLYSAELFQNFVAGYKNFILENDIKNALANLNDLRVLCAIKEGGQGLKAVNQSIEKYLEAKGLLDLRAEFYINRPIIITSNNYELGLFNGDIGLIRPDETGAIKVWFEDGQGNLKAVYPGLIDRMETVFAMTIHKSQGSEFDKVLIILPQTENIAILTRELLYTGVTRAKSKVYLQGAMSVIKQTAENTVQRASGIAQRFITN